MKKVIQSISFIIATLGFVFLLYGSIKLARVEAATVPQDIETGIPGIEIVQPSKVLSREDAQVIIGVSVAALAIGIAGYFVSSRTDFGETVPRIGSSRTKPQPNIMQESTVYRPILVEGEVKKQREIATNSLREGLPIAAVARMTEMSIEELQQLQQQIDNPAQN